MNLSWYFQTTKKYQIVISRKYATDPYGIRKESGGLRRTNGILIAKHTLVVRLNLNVGLLSCELLEKERTARIHFDQPKLQFLRLILS